MKCDSCWFKGLTQHPKAASSGPHCMPVVGPHRCCTASLHRVGIGAPEDASGGGRWTLKDQRVEPCLWSGLSGPIAGLEPRGTLAVRNQQGGTLPPWPMDRLAACQDVRSRLHDNVETPKSDSTTNEPSPTAHHDGIKHGAFHASRNAGGFSSRSLPKEVKLRRRSRRGGEKGLATSDEPARAPALWTSRRRGKRVRVV